MIATADSNLKEAPVTRNAESVRRREAESRSFPQTRSEAEFAAADRHSRRVHFLKFGLPILALFVTGFFSAATFLADPDAVDAGTAPVVMDGGRIVMANPKLEGFTADKRPYKMIADRAIQESVKSTAVELQNIAADLPFGTEATAKLSAATGIFDNASNKLDLADNIRLVTSDGMKADLSSASINISSGEMSTNKPVDIVTDRAHITADRMQIIDNGKVIVFESRVRLNIAANTLKKAGSGISK